MENKITPTHLAIAVVVIVAAVIALPMISSAYNTAYPPTGSFAQRAMDTCAKESKVFSRWSKEDVEVCLAFQGLK